MARRRATELLPPDLHATLDALTVDVIKSLLGAVQGRKRSTGRKAELVDELCRTLRGDSLRTVWGKLDDVERAAVAEAAHDPEGVFREDRFEAKYGTRPAWRRGARGRTFSHGEPTMFAAMLPDGRLPPDLRAELLGFVLEPEAARLRVCESLPAAVPEGGHADAGPDEDMLALEVRETELAARLDLRAVLGLLGTGRLGVGQTTRLPGEAACRAVGDVLHGGDFFDDDALAADDEEPVGPVRAFAWPLLLQAAGLAGTSGKRLEPSAGARKAVSDAPAVTLRLLWRRWCGSALFDEMRRTDAIKGQTGKAKRGFTSARGRREAIAAALARCPAGEWVEVDELFRFMRAGGDDFEVTQDPWSLYLTDSNYGSLGHAGYHDWILLQGRYALCVLFEYAATLGMIDVAYTVPHGARADFRDLWGTEDLAFLSRYDGLRYLRLTPLGAYCLGLEDRYEPSEPERRALLAVESDGAIRSLAPGLDAAERSLLDAFAAPVGEDAWRVSVESLLGALESGADIDELSTFLRARADAELPEPVERDLASAVERATLLQDIGGARLIECRDADLVALVANDPKCAKYCRALDEHHLVVRDADAARFRTAVRALGYGVRVR